jgi:hypothetical protein
MVDPSRSSIAGQGLTGRVDVLPGDMSEALPPGVAVARTPA